MRILLVEDNHRLSAIIGEALKANGFAVDNVALAADAEAAIESTRYDAIVLDLGLPDRDGMTLLAPVRRRGVPTPVLVLTSRDGTQAILDGLNGGADDYLLKPFVMDELLARIRVLLRRPGQALSLLLREQNLEFDTIERRVRIGGIEIELSRRELGALEHFMRRSGRVISKADMEEALYGFGEELGSNAIEVLMHRLRKKLSAAGADMEIHTLRGIGYMLSSKPS
ncbi:MAG: response regulator [Hyphomicrobiales bacterium]